MKNVKIYYLLNEKGRKENIKNGGEGKMLQCIETPATEEILQLKACNVSENGEIILPIGFQKNALKYALNNESITNSYSNGVIIEKKLSTGFAGKPCINNTCEIVYFSKTMSAEDLVKAEQKRLDKINVLENSLQKELKIQLEIFEKKEAEREVAKREEAEREEARKKEARKKETEKKERELEQKSNWIKEHGSEYLKKAYSLGYDCQRKYVEEYRNSLPILKDFIIDFNDSFEYSDRTMPSIDALNAQIALKNLNFDATVVWVTSPATEEIYEDYELGEVIDNFEEQEGIMIENFLGRYDLVKLI